MTKAIKKISSDPQRDHGTKCFSQLPDKGLQMLGCVCHLEIIFILFN